MEIIELKPPHPWSRQRRAKIWDFRASGVLQLPTIHQRKLGRLEIVLGDRRSRREFKVPLTLQQLGDVLWHSYRVRRTARMDGGFLWESRPSPSGGGCYPIQVLVLRAAFLPRSLLLYDPNYHVFGVRDLAGDRLVMRCVGEVEQCLKAGKGTIFWFVADLGRSGRRYRNPESLAWRDSGALLATIGLVAGGMGLDWCGVGLHEIPSLRKFLKLEDWVIGVGGCIISGR